MELTAILSIDVQLIHGEYVDVARYFVADKLIMDGREQLCRGNRPNKGNEPKFEA